MSGNFKYLAADDMVAGIRTLFQDKIKSVKLLLQVNLSDIEIMKI